MKKQTKTTPGNPYTRQLNVDCWEQGYRAHQEGVDLESCPISDYPGRSLQVAWRKGWEYAAEVFSPEPEVQEPEVRTPEPEVRVHDPSLYWPEAKARPSSYRTRGNYPCANCNRVLTDNLSRAVRCGSVLRGADGLPTVAYLYCVACGHRWGMPAREGV